MTALADLLTQYAEMPQLFEMDEEFAEQFAAHGEEISNLFSETTDARMKLVAAGALAQIDPSEVNAILPVLMAALETSTKTEVNFAMYCLGLLGSISAAALPALIRLLKGENMVVVSNAARALGQIGSSKSVPHLIELLGNPDCADDAAIALGDIGPAAQEAIPALRTCVQLEGTDDAFVRALRLAAANAIWKISGDFADVLAVATEMLDDEEEWLCFNACHQLMELGPAAQPAADHLQRLLGHHDQCVREQAAKALASCWFGPIH